MNDIGITEEYEQTYNDIITKDVVTRADWEVIFNNIDDQTLVDRYHKIITKNNTMYEMDHVLTSFEHRDIADVYYVSLSQKAWAETKADPTNLILFMVVLFVVLIAMSVYRTQQLL